jgi:hypothetical protein
LFALILNLDHATTIIIIGPNLVDDGDQGPCWGAGEAVAP